MSSLSTLLATRPTQQGVTLDALSRARPVLVVFLRHFG
jgi:hypothetical protein